MEHWASVGAPPAVSTAIIDQAILSRTFFDAGHLIVAENDGKVEGWCHFVADPFDADTVTLCGVCFTSAGLSSCDQLFSTTESMIKQQAFKRILVGPIRDQHFGYAGLAPLGHGIGVSVTDARTASLLSRHGYSVERSVAKMLATTNPYRMPVSREALQLRRTTRLEHETWFPADPQHASAMAHLDIQHHRLVNHRTGEQLADLNLWISDPEAQVMDCATAILEVNEAQNRGSFEPAETFLIGSVVQLLANQRVFSVETAVDSQLTELIDQLTKLHFQNVEQGQRWEKLVA